MEILAKKLQVDGKIVTTQTLEDHTNWVIEEALNLVDESSLKRVSKISGWDKDKILDLIFFSAYFHDIGKATKEFQNTINNGGNSYHSLYSASVLSIFDEFDINGEHDSYINLLMILCLTHHTLLELGKRKVKCNYLSEAESFFYRYKNNRILLGNQWQPSKDVLQRIPLYALPAAYPIGIP